MKSSSAIADERAKADAQANTEALLEHAARFPATQLNAAHRQPTATPTRPLHAEVAEWLERAMRQDRFGEGARMPSERQLVVALGVSRTTVRKALEVLTGKGLLGREIGSRIWRVRKDPPIEVSISEFSGFTAQLIASGVAVSTRSVEVWLREATPGECASFGLDAGDEVYEGQRVRDLEGEPVLLERFVIARRVAPGLTAEQLTGSVYGLLEREYGHRPELAKQRVYAAVLDGDEAERLGRRPGVAVLRLERTTTDEAGAVIELGDDIVCSDRLSLTTRGQVPRDTRR